MNFRSGNKVKAEWGMASMTDMVFLLLIFFIIMSLMANNQFTVELPKAANEPSNVDPVEVSVVITEDNKYVVMPGGDMENPMDLESIKNIVRDEMAKSKEAKLKIAGHKRADYDAVFAVFALAKANNWTPVLAFDK